MTRLIQTMVSLSFLGELYQTALRNHRLAHSSIDYETAISFFMKAEDQARSIGDLANRYEVINDSEDSSGLTAVILIDKAKALQDAAYKDQINRHSAEYQSKRLAKNRTSQLSSFLQR